jgi:hypothetical protein
VPLVDQPHPHINSAADTEATTYNLEEGGVSLRLTIVSTVGIGDQVYVLLGVRLLFAFLPHLQPMASSSFPSRTHVWVDRMNCNALR